MAIHVSKTALPDSVYRSESPVCVQSTWRSQAQYPWLELGKEPTATAAQ